MGVIDNHAGTVIMAIVGDWLILHRKNFIFIKKWNLKKKSCSLQIRLNVQ